MTLVDTIEETGASASKPRAKAPVRRKPPVPRMSNGTVDQLAAMQREIDALKEGRMKTTPSAPFNPISAQREAGPEELTPFLQELRAQTRDKPADFAREGISYNWPERLFCKPDGSVVSLQGDPENRVYYRDKGFVELSKEQVKAWYGGERQKVIEIQREKAGLILNLREMVARDPNLKASISTQTEMAWDHMSCPELEAFMDEVLGIPDQNGKPRRKLQPPQRLIDAENRKADHERDRMMAGVETVPPKQVRERFESSLPTPTGRTRETNAFPPRAAAGPTTDAAIPLEHDRSHTQERRAVPLNERTTSMATNTQRQQPPPAPRTKWTRATARAGARRVAISTHPPAAATNPRTRTASTAATAPASKHRAFTSRCASRGS